MNGSSASLVDGMFRVAVVIGGLIPIVLGYCLIMGRTHSTSFGLHNMTLRVRLSVFGAVLILVMLVQGNQQLRASNRSDGVSVLIQEGLAFERAGNIERAGRTYMGHSGSRKPRRTASLS